MKKKKYGLTMAVITALSALSVLPGKVSAQRYLPSQKAIQITGGVTDADRTLEGYHAGIAYSGYTRNGNRWLYGAEVLSSRHSVGEFRVPLSQFTGEAGYYINFLSDRKKNFFFSFGLSALAGYEAINRGKRTLHDGSLITDRSGFVYGGAASFEIEAYLTDRIAMLLNVRERALWGSDVGKFHNQIGIGIKYILK